eukprot:scaffold7041_cov39-Isochrysis_galbana.AAC.1
MRPGSFAPLPTPTHNEARLRPPLPSAAVPEFIFSGRSCQSSVPQHPPPCAGSEPPPTTETPPPGETRSGV